MKRLVKQLTIVLLLVLSSVSGVSATEFSTELKVNGVVRASNEFTVTLSVEGATDLKGLVGKIEYDASKVTLVKAVGLNGFNATLGENIVLDTLDGLSGRVDLAEITFRATSSFLATQSSVISISGVEGSNGQRDLSGASISVSVVADTRFSDVPLDYRAYKHIMDLADKSVINGYSDMTFRPNANITRAQAAIMIVRAVGLEYRGKTSSFTDVPSSHSAYEFISAAYDAGILSGYSDGTYRPNANITRAQIAIMVTRAFNLSHSGKEVSFTDVPDGYAPKRFIETLASHGVINGYSDGTFRPNNHTTRAQFSIMIYNALNLVKKSK